MNKTVILRKEVHDKLEEVREEYLKHHPEMKNIRLSYNKLIYETIQFYLNN